MKNAIRSATLKKAMWLKSIVPTALCLLLSINAMGQNLDVKKTSTPIVIDGNFTDCGWANANFVTFTNAVAGVPTLAATTLVTAITNTTATSGGNVTYDGGTSVTARGVCWATSQNPTTANSKTTNGTGTGTFTSSLTGLTLGTTYYVRAYATNTTGTGYGTQVSFITTGGGGGWHAPAPTNSWVESVISHGATPNDGTDDTYAIQATVDWLVANHSGGTVLVPAGTYNVTISTQRIGAAFVAILLKSNMTFKMETGAVIKLNPNSSGNYAVLDIEGRTNVNVIGGTLHGERHEHTGAYAGSDFINCPGCAAGEWGMGIWVASSSNIYMESVESIEMWGDGFYVDGNSSNVNYYSVIASDCRRQGLSIVWVNGCQVRNSIFTNIRGTAPQSGIDIEPMGSYETVNNVQISDCQFTNSYGAGLALEHNNGIQSTNNVTVTNSIITGNRWGLCWTNPGTGSSYTGMTISGNSICNLNLPDGSCSY